MNEHSGRREGLLKFQVGVCVCVCVRESVEEWNVLMDGWPANGKREKQSVPVVSCFDYANSLYAG